MRIHLKTTPALAAALCLGAAALTGCQAERSVMEPVDADWSYRDGQTQLSNNDAWRQMIPDNSASALLGAGDGQVASVEDRVD